MAFNCLRDIYSVQGIFYVDAFDRKCRKSLDLIRVDSERVSPEIVVVMMNPGSSHPLNDVDDDNILTPTYADPTQLQVMAVMENVGIQFARILNLSDLRNPKSSEFYSELDKRDDLTHSIFHESRTDDFNSFFIRDVPIILAWGVNFKLNRLATLAVERIPKSSVLLGKHKDGNFYYHARPHLVSSQKEWVSCITQQYTQLATS